LLMNQPGAQFILSIFNFVNLFVFRVAMSPSSGDKTVFMRHLVLVILCGWLYGMQKQMLLRTIQSSTQNNKYQVSEHMLLHTRQSSIQNNNTKCRSICSCIPDSHQYIITSNKCRSICSYIPVIHTE